MNVQFSVYDTPFRVLRRGVVVVCVSCFENVLEHSTREYLSISVRVALPAASFSAGVASNPCVFHRLLSAETVLCPWDAFLVRF